MYNSTANANTLTSLNPSSPPLSETGFVSDVELDLSGVRSRITDMTMDSQSIVTDLLVALAPLHRHVVDVIDLSRGGATEQPLLAFRS